jgi:CheY-like chemotaxis protein
MPVMDGYECTRAIRSFENRTLSEDEQHVRGSRALIIAITGNTGGKDESQAFKSGLDVYMTKPVSFKDVGKLLDSWKED